MKDTIYTYLDDSGVNYMVEVTSDRLAHRFEDAKLRTIARNEIVIEYDIDFIPHVRGLYLNTIKTLRDDGYSFFVFDHQSRSPHIHVYKINGLELMTPEVRHEYKKQFLRRYGDKNLKYVDKSLAGDDHPIAMEYRPHFKHGTEKVLVFSSSYSLDNNLDMELLNTAKDIVDRRRESKEEELPYGIHNWFIEMCIKEEFPQGQWANVMAKNLMIEIVRRNLDEDKILNKLRPEDRKVVSSWKGWVEKEPRFFGYSEVKNYLENYGKDYYEEKTKHRIPVFEL